MEYLEYFGINACAPSTQMRRYQWGWGTRNIYWWGMSGTYKWGFQVRAHPEKGVLGAGTSPKGGGGSQERAQSEKWDLRHFSCKKRGSQELNLHKRGLLGAYLSHIFTFTCQYDLQTKMRGLRNGHNQKRVGGLRGAPNSKKGGLRCGSGKTKWVFTAAHTCESPPSHNVGSGTTEKYGTWNLLQLFVGKKSVLRHEMITVSKYYLGIPANIC